MAEIDLHEEMSKAVAHLTAAATNMGLYSAGHPQVGRYVERSHAALTGILQTRPEVTIMLIGNDLVAENRPLPTDSAYVESFIRILRRKGVERVTFAAGLSRAEFQAFILDLASSKAVSVRSSGSIKLGK